jgi:hypothetical protein
MVAGIPSSLMPGLPVMLFATTYRDSIVWLVEDQPKTKCVIILNDESPEQTAATPKAEENTLAGGRTSLGTNAEEYSRGSEAADVRRSYQGAVGIR